MPLMAIDPQNPQNAAPPLSDEDLRALFGDDLLQPLGLQRWV
jgi:hypothetical protein